LANDIEGDVMQLPLPATSIFGKEDGENRPLQAYARWLAAQTVNPNMVVTRMKFDTKAESPKLFFKAMRWLTEEEYATVGDQGETPEATKAITMNVAQVDKVKAPLELEGQAPKGKAKPAPAVEEEDEAPAPKPKAKAKPAPVEVDEDEDDEPPAPKPKAKAKPAPVAEDDDAEPEVRKAEKKPTAVPGKKDLASVVGAWDDED
jgi:hypothetical protein